VSFIEKQHGTDTTMLFFYLYLTAPCSSGNPIRRAPIAGSRRLRTCGEKIFYHSLVDWCIFVIAKNRYRIFTEGPEV
jgi:hypothetical protein